MPTPHKCKQKVEMLSLRWLSMEVKLPVECAVSPNYWRYIQSQCSHRAIFTSSSRENPSFRRLGTAHLAIKDRVGLQVHVRSVNWKSSFHLFQLRNNTANACTLTWVTKMTQCS